MKLKDTYSQKESYDQPSSIFKSRNITLPTKVRLVKAMVFPAVMHWCESWTIKKAECQRNDAFKLWCWKRLLSLLDSKRSNQSILKEISSEYSLEGLMLRLKLQFFWLPKSQLIGKDPDDGKNWRQEVKGMTDDEMVGWLYQLNGQEFEQTPGDNEGQGSLACCSPWGRKELVGQDWVTKTTTWSEREEGLEIEFN